MKNILRRILQVLSIFTSIFTLLAIISCNNVITQKQTDKNINTEDYAVLKISVDETNTARLVEPVVEVNQLTDIVLKGVITTEGTTQTQLGSWKDTAALAKSAIELKAGTWNFTLTAKYGSEEYTGTSNDVLLEKGKSKSISFTLFCITPASDGKGKITVTISYPENTAKKAEITLVDANDSSSVIKNEDKILSGSSLSIGYTDIPNGEYILNINFYTDSGIFLGTYTELVTVAANKESKANRTVNSFNKLYTITYILNGGSWVSGSTAPAAYSSRGSVILPTGKDVQREGFAFKGWYTDENCTDGNEITKIAVMESGNKTFYAKWADVTDADISLEEDIQTNNGVAITVNIPSDDVDELKIMRSFNGQKYHIYYSATATKDNSFAKGAYTIYDYSTKTDDSYSYYAEIKIGDSVVITNTASITATVDSDYTMPLITNVPTASYDESEVLFKFTLRPVFQHTELPFGFVVDDACLFYYYNNSPVIVLLDELNNMGEYSLFPYSAGRYGFTGYDNTVEVDGFCSRMSTPADFGQYYIYSDDSTFAKVPEELYIPNNLLEFKAENTEEGVKLTLNIPSKTYNIPSNVSDKPFIEIYRDEVKIMDYKYTEGKIVLNDNFVKAGETYKYRAEFSYKDANHNNALTNVRSETVSVTKQKDGIGNYWFMNPPKVSFTSDCTNQKYMQYYISSSPLMVVMDNPSNQSNYILAEKFYFNYIKYLDANSNKVMSIEYIDHGHSEGIDLRNYVFDSNWNNSTLYLMSAQATWEITGTNGAGHYYYTFDDSQIGNVPASITIPAKLEYDISGNVTYEAVSSGNTITLGGFTSDTDGTDVTVTVHEKGSSKITTLAMNKNVTNSTIYTLSDTFVEAGKTYIYDISCKKNVLYSYPTYYRYYGNYSFELEAIGGATYDFTAKDCNDGIELSFDVPETDSIQIIKISRALQNENGNHDDWKEIWEYTDYDNVISAQKMTVMDYFDLNLKTFLYRVEYCDCKGQVIFTKETSEKAGRTGKPTPSISSVPEVITADLYNMCLVYDGNYSGPPISFVPKDYTVSKTIIYTGHGDDEFSAQLDIDNPDYSSLLNQANLNKKSKADCIQIAFCAPDGKSRYVFKNPWLKDRFPEIRIPATLDRTILSVDSKPDGMEFKVFVPQGTDNVSMFNEVSGQFIRKYYVNKSQADEIITFKDRYDCRKGHYYQYYIVYNWWGDKNKTPPVLCQYDSIPKPSFTTLPTGTFDSTTKRLNFTQPEIEFYDVDSALKTSHLEFHYKCDETGSQTWRDIYRCLDSEYFDFSDDAGGLYKLKDVTLYIDDESGQFMFFFVPSDFPDMPQSFYIDKTYTATFMVDGTVFDTQSYKGGSVLTKPASEPTKDGYVFYYWTYEDPVNGTTEYDFKTKAFAEDIVLTAKWGVKLADTITVTINPVSDIQVDVEKNYNNTNHVLFSVKNSGYEYYNWQVDENQKVYSKDAKTFEFIPSNYTAGLHIIYLEATDYSGKPYSFSAMIRVESNHN